MTVAELIELLKTLPQDAQVVAENDRSDISIVSERCIEYCDNKYIPETENDGGRSVRTFRYPEGSESEYYAGPYVEIFGCATW